MKTTPELIADIKKAIADGATEYYIEPGVYYFNGDTPQFNLQNVSYFNVYAYGVKFMFEPRKKFPSVRLHECTSVGIYGLTVDFYPLPFAQGVITSIDKGNKKLRVTLDAFAPVITNEWSAVNGGDTKVICFNPDGLLHAKNTRLDHVQQVANLTEHDVEITVRGTLYSSPDAELDVGCRVAMPDRSFGHCIQSRYCGNLVFQDVTVNACSNMAFSESLGNGRNIYRNCRIMRKGSRLLSSNADGFHSSQMVFGPTIIECRAEFTGDDTVNVHGFTSFVIDAGDGPMVFARSNDYFYAGKKCIVQRGVKPAFGTDVLTFARVDDEALRTKYFEAVRTSGMVENVQSTFDLYQVATSRLLEHGDFLGSNDELCMGPRIISNRFTDIYGRGILMCARSGLINDNVMQRLGGAGIHVGADLHWSSGPFPHHIKINRNVIVDAHRLYRLGKQPASITLANIGTGENSYTKTPLVELAPDNIVVNPGREAIFIA